MAAAKKAPAKKKPVSKSQANKVSEFMKKQGNGGPAVPDGDNDNPVTTGMDDNDGDESQGA